MQNNYGDNTCGDRLAAGTYQTFKCSRCGNMFAVSQSVCDICGNQCSESTCDVIPSSNEDF